MESEEGENDLRQALLPNNDGNTEEEIAAAANASRQDEQGDGQERSSFLARGNGNGNDDGNNDGNNSEEGEETSQQSLSHNNNTGQAILAIAVPALAGLAIDPLMTLADTAFVGRTATDSSSLAGMGSAAALLTFSFYLFNFLCTVTTPLVSQRRASGDVNGAIVVGGQALTLAILLGILLTLVLLVFSEGLLRVMGTGQTGHESHQFALDFLHFRAVAAPAVFVISASTGILRGYLDTKTTVVILLGSNLVNFSLDVVLIGWLKMGPKGAAIATTTAEWISALTLLLILAGKIPSVDGKLGSNQQQQESTNATSRNGDDHQEDDDDEEGELSAASVAMESAMSALLQSSEQPPPSKTIIAPTCKIPAWEATKPLVVASSSVFVRSFMLHLSIVGAAAMATRAGGGSEEASATSIAAHQIALQLWLLCSFVCDALAAASQALVADHLGRNDEVGVRTVSRTIFAYGLVLGMVLAGALGIGDYTGVLLKAFTSDAPTQEALKPLLAILIVAQPLNSFVFAADGVLQGASVFAYQAKSMVLSVLVAFASFYCFVRFFGIDKDDSNSDSSSGITLVYVWYSLLVLQLMRGLTSLWKLADRNGPIDLFHIRHSV